MDSENADSMISILNAAYAHKFGTIRQDNEGTNIFPEQIVSKFMHCLAAFLQLVHCKGTDVEHFELAAC
ncbi:hypothetical protein RPW65_00530 [Pseudomonas sp. NyZ704]|nr:hypothetical protein RPW65_00530 [Pseudomonas sp. NyZ704]